MADELDVLYESEITVLGVGNVILSDEGFGVRVAEYLDAHYDLPESVQVLDGGTLGLELMQYVTGTKKLLVVDSIDGGGAPGTRYHFDDDEVKVHFKEKISAHEIGVQDMLALLELTGKAIEHVTVIGAQPYDLGAGVNLSSGMKALVVPVAEEAVEMLRRWGVDVAPKAVPDAVDYTVVAEDLSSPLADR